MRTKLSTLVLLLLIAVNIGAKNTTFLLDRSGSMQGMSVDRNAQSFSKISVELSDFINSHPNDLVKIVSFTDEVLDVTSLEGGKHENIQAIKSLTIPLKGNTDIAKVIDYLRSHKELQSADGRIVFITDGQQNIRVSNESLVQSVAALQKEFSGNIYFLLLDEKDAGTKIATYFSNSDDLYLIKSLSDIDKIEIVATEEVPEETKVSEQPTEILTHPENAKSITWNWMWLFWVLLAVVVLCIILLFVYFAPLFLLNNVAAIQKSLGILFNLPEWLFNLILKFGPDKLRSFVSKTYPPYASYARGYVKPTNDVQAKVLKEMEEKTGKRPKYRNGTMDFSNHCEARVKLKGGLDNNIPKNGDPRANVSKAQNAARDILLKSKRGQDLIASYTGKNPQEITVDDYTAWKDDSLGKRGYPLTPHETPDGTEIQWVNKYWHDVSLGGISHTGGVSMLKSIRNAFG